jgi:enolase
MQTLAAIYHDFQDRYSQRINGINDEGAYITNFTDEETIEAVQAVAGEHGAAVGIDAAATEFYNDTSERYEYPELDMAMPPKQQRKFMETLIDRYNLVYVEDPFHEEDFEQTAQLTANVQDCLIVGDDLFTTNVDRLQHGVNIDAGNGIIVKPNQVGTVSDTDDTLNLAEQHGYTPIMSHRSGETCDPAIADLAVAWETPFIKAGIAGIRTAKNNQLLRLWDRLDGEIANIPV